MGQSATADTNTPATAPAATSATEQSGFGWLSGIFDWISKLWNSFTSSGIGQDLTVWGRAIGNWFTGTMGDPVQALGINPPTTSPANTPSTDPAAIKNAAQTFVPKGNVLPSATNDTNATPLPSGAPRHNESASNTRENNSAR